ncbi:TPA: hypothetical protein NJ048_004435 [Vibrio parahaemolyticus]|nr:hypothetical protein [Vibrio parahaemolyticus]
MKLKDRILGLSKSIRPALGEPVTQTVQPEPLEPKERKSMFISTIIDLDLWNKAGWKAMSTIVDPSFQSPPVLGFVFGDNQVGDKIFHRLKKQFGYSDHKNEIRVSVIHGISKSRPQDYKVHFGSDWESMVEKLEAAGLEPDESMIMSLSRIHEMNPNNDTSMAMFKSSFEYFNEFYITNVIMDKKKGLRPSHQNMIKMTNINFRTKDEVLANEHDPDSVVFSSKE